MHNASQAHIEAEDLSRKVMFNDWIKRFKNQHNELIPFHMVGLLKPQGEHYLGHQTIEVEKIIGSTDRYSDFDAHFLPKEETTIHKWKHLRTAQLNGVEFPPIEVYKVGEVYFVKDGNHRTALAKANGQIYIDAYVTELNIPVELDPNNTVEDFIIKGEYANFLTRSRIDRACPEHVPIIFTKVGRYDVLYDHIRTHRYFMGLNQKRSITREEATKDWYERLYLPTLKEIEDNHLMSEFPGRTEADLYLWISDYRYYQSQSAGQDIGAETAAEHVHKQNRRPAHKVLDWFKDTWNKFF